METWIKPNGTEIEINENSAEFAESIGWVRKSAQVEQEAPKRRGRPPKSSYAIGDDE